MSDNTTSAARAPNFPAEDLEAAQRDFLTAYPDYARTRALDDLRATDYARLDRADHIYLDYTGGGLYGESQLRRHMDLLREQVFGNPHSHNPTSSAMTDLVEGARAFVLRYFNADPGEYECIFTPNASGALKLVGESYPFAPGGRYALTSDNHNSVNGIREFARTKGAATTYVPVRAPELRLDRAALRAALAEADAASHNLFAFTAQSNFSGVQHPLEMIDEARALGWDVLADCAAFAPSNRLDLGRWRPDFVSLSFYKIFGYPTGVGALIARKAALKKLRRPWFAGGTITIASVAGDGHYLAEGSAGFEDGTVNYLALPAVEIGLRHIESIGIDIIHERVMCLTGWLLDQFSGLRHANGAPLAHVLGPAGTDRRGGTIAFNLVDPSGAMLPAERIEELAGRARISLRTGCFCNPGAGEAARGLAAQDMRPVFAAGKPLTFSELNAMTAREKGFELSAMRLSVGLATTFADVYAFMRFAASFRDCSAADVGSTARAPGALRRDTP